MWGEKFITDCLQLSLPSLLAPGNIPALAANYSLRFVFLSREQDIPVFENSQAFQKLKSICDVEFISIADLIVFNNYSTTLTLAYDRAVRQTGEQMLNTYFVFLTSDYIMADGSLEGLMRYIKKGYSGICTGNFQVIEEKITPFLLNKIDPLTQTMSINSRDLLKQSFKSLHPIVYASLYDFGISHNYYANRFFIKQDQVIAGRFYLLHMLCIKPETTEYKVGASCDYSFIPEMCPSGNIGVINDSDDYLVIEMQSRSHELQYVQPGPYDPKKLIISLAEWTTKQHRENALHTIYFHADDLRETDKIALDNKLSLWIDERLKNLQKYSIQPFYNHPFWNGAIKSFYQQKKILKKTHAYDYFDLLINDNTFAKRWYYYFFGTPPLVPRWHFRWLEYQSVMNTLKSHIKQYDCHDVAIFYEVFFGEFMRYHTWLKNSLSVNQHYYTRSLLYSKSKLLELQKQKFKFCVLMIQMEEMENMQDTLIMLKSLLKKNAKLLIFIPNGKNQYSRYAYDFQSELTYKLDCFTGAQYAIQDIKHIHNKLTLLGRMVIDKINRQFSYSKKLKFLFYAMVGVPGTLFCFIKNCLPNIFNKNTDHCTNILLTLTPEED